MYEITNNVCMHIHGTSRYSYFSVAYILKSKYKKHLNSFSESIEVL